MTKITRGRSLEAFADVEEILRRAEVAHEEGRDLFLNFASLKEAQTYRLRINRFRGVWRKNTEIAAMLDPSQAESAGTSPWDSMCVYIEDEVTGGTNVRITAGPVGPRSIW